MDSPCPRFEAPSTPRPDRFARVANRLWAGRPAHFETRGLPSHNVDGLPEDIARRRQTASIRWKILQTEDQARHIRRRLGYVPGDPALNRRIEGWHAHLRALTGSGLAGALGAQAVAAGRKPYPGYWSLPDADMDERPLHPVSALLAPFQTDWLQRAQGYFDRAQILGRSWETREDAVSLLKLAADLASDADCPELAGYCLYHAADLADLGEAFQLADQAAFFFVQTRRADWTFASWALAANLVMVNAPEGQERLKAGQEARARMELAARALDGAGLYPLAIFIRRALSGESDPNPGLARFKADRSAAYPLGKQMRGELRRLATNQIVHQGLESAWRSLRALGCTLSAWTLFSYVRFAKEPPPYATTQAAFVKEERRKERIREIEYNMDDLEELARARELEEAIEEGRQAILRLAGLDPE